MKALSLYQPWATLVVAGRKRCETRTWQTSHRGLLAIHAARLFPRQLRELCRREPIQRLLAEAGFNDVAELPRGVLLGTVQVRGCVRTEEMDVDALSETDRLLGNFGPGRWVWLLEQTAQLETPVPCRGWLGVFDVPADLPGLDIEAFRGKGT
jgi:activating signal cointegrator 1